MKRYEIKAQMLSCGYISRVIGTTDSFAEAKKLVKLLATVQAEETDIVNMTIFDNKNYVEVVNWDYDKGFTLVPW